MMLEKNEKSAIVCLRVALTFVTILICNQILVGQGRDPGCELGRSMDGPQSACIRIDANGYEGAYYVNNDVKNPRFGDWLVKMSIGSNSIEIGGIGYTGGQIGIKVEKTGDVVALSTNRPDSAELSTRTISFKTTEIEIFSGDYKGHYWVNGFGRAAGDSRFVVVKGLSTFLRVYERSGEEIGFSIDREGSLSIPVNHTAIRASENKLFLNTMKLAVDPGDYVGWYRFAGFVKTGFSEFVVVPNVRVGLVSEQGDTFVLPNRSGSLPAAVSLKGNIYRFIVAPEIPNLMGWWTANKKSNDSLDHFGSEVIGTLSYSLQGAVGPSFQFGNGGYVSVDGAAFLKQQGSFMFWFKVNKTSLPGGRTILSGGCSPLDCTNRTPVIGIEGGKLYVAIGESGQVLENVNVNQDKTWHHVVLSYKQDSAWVYFDGRLVTAFSKESFGPKFSFPSKFGIGKGINLNGNDFNGQIDEVRVYWRALENYEVQWIYLLEKCSECRDVFDFSDSELPIP